MLKTRSGFTRSGYEIYSSKCYLQNKRPNNMFLFQISSFWKMTDVGFELYAWCWKDSSTLHFSTKIQFRWTWGFFRGVWKQKKVHIILILDNQLNISLIPNWTGIPSTAILMYKHKKIKKVITIPFQLFDNRNL